jgi:hypothetical protein
VVFAMAEAGFVRFTQEGLGRETGPGPGGPTMLARIGIMRR